MRAPKDITFGHVGPISQNRHSKNFGFVVQNKSLVVPKRRDFFLS
jgi:hypothetical protein